MKDMIMKKGTALLLAFAMAVTMLPMLPAETVQAATDTAASGSDAFAALGIDTSVAPEGFDANSIDNPYGRNTIKVNTVSELYTVQLGDETFPETEFADSKEANPNTQAEEPKGKTSTDTKITNQSLSASLYGNEKWNQTTTNIMGSPKTQSISSTTTTVTGNYIRLNKAGSTHESSGQYTVEDYYTGISDIASEQGVMYDVAAGNFDGNTQGKAAQIAMVYAKNYSSTGGLYLRFGDATASGTNDYGDSITLLADGKEIGNPTLTYNDALVENFVENPYQLKNYLQVATGDWNGDGTDEVAVYIPEKGNSRIAVYAYQGGAADSYKNTNKWALAWTYYLKEGDVVSNMISLTSGDVDKDGIDDLACTWGYYYGPDQNKGSKAVVMFGGKDTDILKRSQSFDLTYGSSNLVRAAFVFGDIGTGEDSLILCGQSDADLQAGNTYSRYVALYVWNGTRFEANIAQNFDLFGMDEDGNLLYSAMSRSGDKVFYSLPLCPANTAIITKGISDDGGNKLYFDSLIFTYTKEGLTLSAAWDIADIMPGNNKKSYVEYDGAAGDMTGATGAGTLMTVTQTLTEAVDCTVSYTDADDNGAEIKYGWTKEEYYHCWWCRLIGHKRTRWVWGVVSSTSTQHYNKMTWGDTCLVTVEGEHGYREAKKVNPSFSLCLANTDDDSSYMNYTGTASFRYTDPQVLAVLASPPYFKDLLDRDDLSGNYAESTTSYSSTKGSESGETTSSTINAGVYIAFEQNITVFGVTIASFENENVMTAGFTWETEHTASLEQTVSYSATSGEDKVALYSIPMEIYQYETYVPDGNGNYEKVITEVNIPHEACVKLLNLSDYEAIAEDYSVLPQISDTVLRHEIGDPSTYPSSTSGYHVIAQYNGDPASVGFTSKGGGDTISQEIAMSSSNSTSYTAATGVECKIGAGAGGVKAGAILGSENGAGKVTITTSGNSFSGELQAMPAEAEAYGYGMNWKIFCYKYSDGNMTFPVVSYLVSEVKQPAPLPEDFAQDVAKTTDSSVTLKWSYDKFVSGFQLYRYYEFPDGSGSYRLQYVPFSQGKQNEDTGMYEFEYTDTGLSPYTEYQYQIQTESTTKPTVSIYSEPIICRTKTTLGYPDMEVSGLNDNGKLAIYPDSQGEAKVTVKNPENYKEIAYQWQKLTDGSWADLPAYKTDTLKIANASAADKGTYRCRVNVIYFDTTSQKEYYISAYTDELETAYTKRTPAGVLSVEKQMYGSDSQQTNGIHAQVELHSANIGNMTAPLGTVTFTITGSDYEYSETVDLVKNSGTKSFDVGNGSAEEKYYSTASVDVPALSDGAYTVTYYYSGDKNFKDETSESGKMIVIGEGTGYTLHLTDGTNSLTKFRYSTKVIPKLYAATAENPDPDEVQSGVAYKIKPSSEEAESENIYNSETILNVGSYSIYAYVNSQKVAEASFVIEKKPLLVEAISKDNVSDAAADPPVIVTDEDDDDDDTDELDKLGITYQAYNSAGNSVILSSTSDPGNYTITPCFEETPSDEQEQARANYDISFGSATYTIIGATYALTVIPEQYVSGGIDKTVGTAAISSTGAKMGYFTKGTTVQLYAQPDEGYEVDRWEVTATGGSTTVTYDEDNLANVNRLNLSMGAAATEVHVYFKVKDVMLNILDSRGGSVTCDDPSFSSGAIVSNGAEFSLTAVPAEGYTFDKWEINETGNSTVYESGILNADGSNSIAVTVGTRTIDIRPLFVRDSYVVTLEGEISAYYEKQGELAETTVKTYIASGDRIPGDTVIYVSPKTGYKAASGKYICINGTSTNHAAEYNFTLKKTTTISLITERESYTVSADVLQGGGTVSITADGRMVSSGQTVPGGSRVVFTATADRGYVFDHWEVDADDTEEDENGEGSESEATSLDESLTQESFTIEELGAASSVHAVFQENDSHNVTAVVSPNNRGTMRYTLRDIYGNVVGEADQSYTDEFVMYRGETVEFQVVNNPGSMVEQWVLTKDGVDTRRVTTAKTYPDGAITMENSDLTMTVYMVASTYYNLYYTSADANGALTAAADGVAFTSGDKLSGGSEIKFTAAPGEEYMVDYWTVTSGDTTKAENAEKLLDANGLPLVDPVYTIPGLNGRWTVRAHFTTLETKTINLTGTNATMDITYVTPVHDGDATNPEGTTSVQARSGATVKMTVTPNNGYVSSVQKLKDAVSAYCEKAEVVAKTGTYEITLFGINSDLTFDADTCMDEQTVTPGGDSGGSTGGGGAEGGGGAGGGGSLPAEEEKTQEVVTEKNPDTNANITTAFAQVEVRDGTANATVQSESVAEAIKQAVESKSEEIVFNVSEDNSKGADTIQLVISKSDMKQIVDRTSAELKVATTAGDVTILQDALEEIISAAEGQTLTIEIGKVTAPTAVQREAAGENGYIVEVSIESQNKAITSFGGNKLKIRLEIPSALKNKAVEVIHIAKDGTIEKMTGEKLKDGTKEYYEFVTTHLSTFALVDAAEAFKEETPSVTAPKKGSVLTDTKTKMVYKVVKSGTSGGTVRFVKTKDTKAKTVTIPAAVTIDGITYKVTSIASNALKDNKTVTKVVIGKYVTSIGGGAFSGCTNLKSVKIGKNVTAIGAKAFYKCTSLTSLTIPAKVKKIGNYAFKGCGKLKTIKLNTTLLSTNTVSEFAFSGISTQAVIEVPKSKEKSYKKLLVKKGLSKKVQIKKQ